MRIIGVISMLAVVIALTGCSLFTQTSEEPPAIENKDMDLVGRWDYWARLETSITLINHWLMVIKEENCLREDVCQLSGYFEYEDIGRAERKPFSGYSYPKQKLVRLTYEDKNPSGQPLDVIVEFDLFPGNPAPHRAMVGYFIMFNRRAPGPAGNDSYILDIVHRGQATLAGRVSAWPIDSP